MNTANVKAYLMANGGPGSGRFPKGTGGKQQDWERDGAVAAKKGAWVKDNPHPDGSDKAKAWEGQYHQGNADGAEAMENKNSRETGGMDARTKAFAASRDAHTRSAQAVYSNSKQTHVWAAKAHETASAMHNAASGSGNSKMDDAHKSWAQTHQALAAYERSKGT